MSRYGSARLLETIDAIDWKNVGGITERGKLGTNDMLAERDFTQECRSGTEPLAVVVGMYMWFCFTHHQPMDRCYLHKSEEELKRLKTSVIEQIKGAK